MANSLKLYVDPNNANPSLLSRLPNSMRFDSRQESYALNIGKKSRQDFEAQIQSLPYKVIFSQEEQISFNCSNSRGTILYAAPGRVMLKTNAASIRRFEIAGMGDRFTVHQHLRSRPTIKDLQ